MIKILSILFISLSCSFTAWCRIPDGLCGKIAAIAQMKPEDVSPDYISTLLGKPEKIDVRNKKEIWYYTIDNANLAVYWDSHIQKMDKFELSSSTDEKPEWDNDRAKQIKSDRTVLAEVIKILGTPKDMKVKEVNQQLRYDYKEAVLNLFFRNGVLVNYTMY